jgi:hypothetical protein
MTIIDSPQSVVDEVTAGLSHDQISLVESYARNEPESLDRESDSDFEWDGWIQDDRSV